MTIAFDTLRFADRLEAGGFTTEQARTAANALSDAFEETITAKDLDRAVERIESRIGALEQRMDAKFASTDAKFENLEQRIDAKFASTDAKIESLEQRIDARFASTDAKIESLEQRIDAKFASTDAKFESLEQRFDAKLEALETRMVVKLGGIIVVTVGLLGVLLKILH